MTNTSRYGSFFSTAFITLYKWVNKILRFVPGGRTPCPICLNSFVEYSKVGRSPGQNLIKCAFCQLGFYSNRPSEKWLADYYNKTYPHYLEGEWTELDVQATALEKSAGSFVKHASSISPNDVSKCSILDVGSSFPVTAKALMNLGHSTSVVEPSDSARRYASMRGIPSFRTLSEVQNTIFDIVRFSHSLEHLDDPLAALEQSRRILVEGGLLYIAVPNGQSWQFRVLGEKWEWFSYPDHLWYFSAFSLRILLDRAGFEIVSLDSNLALEGPTNLNFECDQSLLEETINTALQGQEITLWAKAKR